MYRNALIGIDATHGGRDPLTLARKLCGPNPHLTLARVHGGRDGVTTAAANARRIAETRGAEVALYRAARLTGVADTASVGALSVGDGLARLVADRRADLLVIGSGDRGPAGIVEVGTWLAQTLTHSSCAVAIAPYGYSTHTEPLRTIGVAYDESPESQHALVLAERFARAHDVELVPFEVPTIAGQGPHSSANHIASRLCDFSAEVDLLVVGPRGAGPLCRLMHPSATLALVHSAEAPLLLITAQTRTPLVGSTWVNRRAPAIAADGPRQP